MKEGTSTRDLGPLTTGNSLVDAQHRHLFDLAERAWQLPSGESDRDEVEVVLFGLARYASTHFADEEALMRSMDYPDLESHHAMHEEFANQVGDLMYRLLTRGEIEASEVAQIVTEWLTEHVQEVDMPMVEYLRARD